MRISILIQQNSDTKILYTMSQLFVVIGITLINLIIGALYLTFGLYQNSIEIRYALKPLIPLFLLAQTMLISSSHKRWSVLLSVIYIISAIGDELLIPDNSITFMIGMLMFAITYLLLADIWDFGKYTFDYGRLIISIIGFIGLTTLFLPPIIIRITDRPLFLIAIIIYALVMMIAGITNLYRWLVEANQWVFITQFWGTFLLITADVILIYNLIVFERIWINAINLCVYWLGLTILGLSVVVSSG